MAPKVSIVTGSYNRPEFLRQAIESVRAQIDPDWEHLIYDAGSTDSRIRAVLEWAAQDSRTRVWYASTNYDQPSAIWNYMMDRAHGRYLTVLDDDNEKLPSFVGAMSRELDQDPSLAVVTCGWRVVCVDKKNIDTHLNLATSPNELAHRSTCDGGAMLYRREAFEQAGYFSEALRTSEDWDWLRRAVHFGKVKNLGDIHATYRSHGGSRMTRALMLGSRTDAMTVSRRFLVSTFGVQLFIPPRDRLTPSQQEVCQGIEHATFDIPWVRRGGDLKVVVAPFRMSDGEAALVAARNARVLSLHMEDPYALKQNLDRVRQMMSAGAEVWVCTNDASAVSHYQQVVGNRVIVCPLLSVDRRQEVPQRERDIDVLFCGHAYPSRKRLMRELLPRLDGKRILLVGDGWENHGVESLPTQTAAETGKLFARARTIVCAHRSTGDCSDGPAKPLSINRGAIEGFFGARIFIDRSRPLHDFDPGDVVWYNNTNDLAIKLQKYLDAPDDKATKFAEKCKTLYTYQTRLARIFNCVRSPRFLAEIP